MYKETRCCSHCGIVLSKSMEVKGRKICKYCRKRQNKNYYIKNKEKISSIKKQKNRKEKRKMLNEVLRLTKGEISTKTILKIDSCLFCKSENIAPIAKINRYKTGFINNWYIRCNNCLARGSEAKTQNDAIAYWNREPQYLQDNSTPNLFEQ